MGSEDEGLHACPGRVGHNRGERRRGKERPDGARSNFPSCAEDLLLLPTEETTQETWNTLKTLHVGADRLKEARMQTLKSEFENFHMRDNDSIDDFAMKMTMLVNQIRRLGDKMEETTL